MIVHSGTSPSVSDFAGSPMNRTYGKTSTSGPARSPRRRSWALEAVERRARPRRAPRRRGAARGRTGTDPGCGPTRTATRRRRPRASTRRRTTSSPRRVPGAGPEGCGRPAARARAPRRARSRRRGRAPRRHSQELQHLATSYPPSPTMLYAPSRSVSERPRAAWSTTSDRGGRAEHVGGTNGRRPTSATEQRQEKRRRCDRRHEGKRLRPRRERDRERGAERCQPHQPGRSR